MGKLHKVTGSHEPGFIGRHDSLDVNIAHILHEKYQIPRVVRRQRKCERIKCMGEPLEKGRWGACGDGPGQGPSRDIGISVMLVFCRLVVKRM